MKSSKLTITIMVMVAVVMGLICSLPAFAGQVVKHEKNVAADGSGDYTTITAALNAITDASATNPYRVTVHPGIYNESITMKTFVDVVGSGQENTKITSSSFTTVTGADNSRLENIWVDNNYTGSSDGVCAVLNENTSMTLSRVIITVSSGSVLAYGIQNVGASTASISDCSVSVTSNRYALGIAATAGADIAITNCQVIVQAPEWTAGILTWYPNAHATVRNSSIRSNGAFDVCALHILGDHNSLRIGGSLISGGICGWCSPSGYSCFKIVNSWDGDYNSIPNL